MPTKVNKPLVRETDATFFEQGKTRNVVVTLEPRVITVRLKGTRRSFSLDIASVYTAAVRAEVARRDRERRGARGRGKR